MGVELKSSQACSGVSFSVGERVTMDSSDAEFVVVNVDHEQGRVELLQLKPGRIQSNVPLASLKRPRNAGLQLVTDPSAN